MRAAKYSATALAAAALGALSLPALGDYEKGFTLGVESFHWEEFGGGGDSLLTEEGPRLTVGAFIGNALSVDAGQFFMASGSLYLGSVDYDGQTIETGAPVRTDTDYVGFKAELLTGYRFGGEVAVDLLGGIGLDSWVRSIQDSRLSDGTQVAGYDESYTVFYLKAGPGLAFGGEASRGRIAGGLKYPLITQEWVDTTSIGCSNDLELEPEPAASLFLSYEQRWRMDNGRDLRLGIYYDSYRFDRSDPDTAVCFADPPGAPPPGYYLFQFVQPESHMDVVGLQVGIGF